MLQKTSAPLPPLGLTTMQMLLAEDDSILGRALQMGLSDLGVTVDWKRNGSDVLSSFRRGIYEVLVLDLGLPDIDGFEVLHRIRHIDGTVPVVIVSARSSVEDKIRGLDFGADDYLTKPFELVELRARLRAVKRRLARNASMLVVSGPLNINLLNHLVTVDNIPIALNVREFSVLRLIAGSVAGASAREIGKALQILGDDADNAVIDAYIATLRNKLGLGFVRTDRGWRCKTDRTIH
jgi:DNA-binding response OmpR family regulator